MDTSEIPKEWSLANICPLFKTNDRSLACNYRPVSLTCVPCKLLEHIVFSYYLFKSVSLTCVPCKLLEHIVFSYYLFKSVALA